MPSSLALIHDYLLVMRGAERSFEAIAECFPDAPIFTLLYDPDGTEGRFAHREIHPSYLQSLRANQARFRRLLPLFPHAAEHLPIQEFGLVLSSTSAFAHGVRPRKGAVHVSYCHSPFRYAWHERERAVSEIPGPLKPVVRHTLRRIRKWDTSAAQRVTAFLANSELTAERMHKSWNRRPDAIIHPPVEIRRFREGTAED